MRIGLIGFHYSNWRTIGCRQPAFSVCLSLIVRLMYPWMLFDLFDVARFRVLSEVVQLSERPEHVAGDYFIAMRSQHFSHAPHGSGDPSFLVSIHKVEPVSGANRRSRPV